VSHIVASVGSAEIQTDNPAAEGTESLTAAELVVVLRGMSRALQAFLIAQARASGLGLLEFLTLIRAGDGDGVIARDAGRSLGLNTSTMTGLIDRLEQDKLIRRHPHPTDRRLLVLRATPKGLREIERALRPLLTELTQLADTLGSDQRPILGSFLDEVSSLVLEQARAARPRPTRRAIARVATTRGRSEGHTSAVP
jgi:DNA-binding MarR family transcriptional regulator